MTKIDWDQSGTRVYENGISHGVFYGSDSRGVPWNGLTSVEETSVDSLDSVHFDGFKYTDLLTMGDFEGVIRAFTYPDEFLAYEGIWQAQDGFYLTHQQKARFGLCYRTQISNDLNKEAGYKLHLIYNLLAIPEDKVYDTLSLDEEPTEFSWNVSAIPEELDNFRPTAYVVIDSRKIDEYLLSDIEDILYGTDETDPRLPDLNSLVTFVFKWGRLIITDLGNGLWEATSPIDGVITMLDSTTFEITSDTAEFIDSPTNDTYEISSSEKNEGDLWPP